MPEKTERIYQIKVTLKDSKPPIWRRLLVPTNITLYELHQIIQTAMGWAGYHLHQFVIYGQYYGDPEDDVTGFMETKNEQRYKLSSFATREGIKFDYQYDFGDGWEHSILVEKILTPDRGAQYPVCIKGRRACPPEDVGGVWGYEEFLEAIQDPSHPEHDDYLDWVGGEFDPAEFNLEEINEMLVGM
ncbi:MAG: plasmid pRiA4b ORF-3 family protein [Chloroflexi bacterium]|nr:plasmid pRiA4b ORF-3 family protein [Chloroflexota bacterium]